ncbi:MAG TPA: 16S rRNA (cytosine(1402)-N(4))-methyltransferase RsmH [Candidatus Saccharimonadales bacterium]|jgi:16S rRNA (cytosine1402-N4)-methyltransferase|nr:16S rRNA (cytosine(1402)-N(4))-methyltransferase RsmH [Candidatus Saccharimonadales bacterium]
MHQDEHYTNHIPVLLQQVLQYLDPRAGDSYLDLTGGYGGHAAAILERTKKPNAAVLVDRDEHAIAELEKKFAGQGTEILQADFLTASRGLADKGRQFDCILADLGVSSPHLNIASRGFSIQMDGPLDMRMDQTQNLTAEQVVNTYRETDLADLIKRYGEEPKARQIASLIVHNRPLHTTSELAKVVAKAWPGRSKVHPATRTFQALRIAVNDELELLRQSLPIWIDNLLAPGGRIAIISFHSLEDRLVKQAFQDAGGDRYDATLQILTKKPVTGDTSELVFNPRARSAKLRAALKQK